mgnify:CR=1 FL=1
MDMENVSLVESSKQLTSLFSEKIVFKGSGYRCSTVSTLKCLFFVLTLGFSSWFLLAYGIKGGPAEEIEKQNALSETPRAPIRIWSNNWDLYEGG